MGSSGVKKTRKRNKPPRRRAFVWCLASLITACALGVCVMSVYADVVHIVKSEVFLKDLPDELDGLTILYASDIHVMGANGKNRAVDLFQKLQALRPDMLLLGGDYASASILERNASKQTIENRRDEFFLSLADFAAPAGKFAVAGNHDTDYDSLERGLALGGIALLRNSGAELKINGASLVVAGAEDLYSGRFDLSLIRSKVSQSDCVIFLCHNPDQFRAINNASARDGGKLADLVLAGDTHGGQFRLGDWVPFNHSIYANRYLTGWVVEDGTPMLISNGVGCVFLNLRFGAPAQVHLITLRKGD